MLFGRRDATGSVPDEVPLVADDVAARELRDIERRGGLVLETAAIGKCPTGDSAAGVGNRVRRR